MTRDEMLDRVRAMSERCDGITEQDREALRHVLALLPPSDDAEPTTPEWLESVGLLGEHDLQAGMRLCVHGDGAYVEYSSSGLYREYAAYELDAETRGDYRALAKLFGVKLREDS